MPRRWATSAHSSLHQPCKIVNNPLPREAGESRSPLNPTQPVICLFGDYDREVVLSLAEDNDVSIPNDQSLGVFASLLHLSYHNTAARTIPLDRLEPYPSSFIPDSSPTGGLDISSSSSSEMSCGTSEKSSTDESFACWSASSVTGSFPVQMSKPTLHKSFSNGIHPEANITGSGFAFEEHYTSPSEASEADELYQRDSLTKDGFSSEGEGTQPLLLTSNGSDIEREFKKHPGHSYWEWDRESQRWHKRGGGRADEDFFPENFA